MYTIIWGAYWLLVIVLGGLALLSKSAAGISVLVALIAMSRLFVRSSKRDPAPNQGKDKLEDGKDLVLPKFSGWALLCCMVVPGLIYSQSSSPEIAGYFLWISMSTMLGGTIIALIGIAMNSSKGSGK